jgi:hypothetical protein
MREVYAEQEKLLNEYGNELKALISGDLAKLNEEAKNLDIPNIIVWTEGEEKAAEKAK